MKSLKRLLLAAVVFFSAGPAGAGTISWTHTPRLERTAEGVRPVLATIQTGDEAAREVGAEFEFNGSLRRSAMLSQAPLGTPIEFAPDAPYPYPAQPGWYPVVFRLRYTDANGYPFSALLARIERMGGETQAPPNEIAIRSQKLEISDEGGGVLRVGNNGSRALSLRGRLLLPTELRGKAPSPGARIEIPAGGLAEVPVEIGTGTALPGSHYVGYLLLEGEDAGGGRIAALGTIEIAVVAPTEAFTRGKPVFVLVLLLALLGLAIPLLRRRRAKAG